MAIRLFPGVGVCTIPVMVTRFARYTIGMMHHGGYVSRNMKAL